MAITRAYVGVTELYLSTDQHSDRRGIFPKEYDVDGCQFAHYGEENGSLVLLFGAFYNLSEIITFLKEHPRPAHREIYPHVEIYDDDTYWGEQGNKNPLKVLKNVNLLEVLETLKEFSPSFAK